MEPPASEVAEVFKEVGVSVESSAAFFAAFGGDDVTFKDLATSTEADLEIVLGETRLRLAPREDGEEADTRPLTALEKSRLRGILECTRRSGTSLAGSTVASAPKGGNITGTKVKIASMLDQRSEAEVERLNSEEINKLFDE